MDYEALLELALPLGLLAVPVALVLIAGVMLLQRSLRAAELCPPTFPLARKLLPGALLLSVVLIARALMATESRVEHTRGLELPLSLALVLSTTYVLARTAWIVAQLVNFRFAIDGPDNLRSRRVRTQLQFVEKLAYTLIAFLGICGTLLQFEGARGFGQSLLASAGAAGIIVGLAAQKSLGNLIAGFQIAFTQPLRIEDAVVVENEWGWVEEISLTYVVIRIWDQRRLVLPITYFVEKPFQNWTRTTAQILGAVTLEVSHQVPFAALEAALYKILDESPLWDRDKRVLQMIEVGERSVTLRALMTAKDSPTCWDLRCHVRRELVALLCREYPYALPVVRLEAPGELRSVPQLERRSA